MPVNEAAERRLFRGADIEYSFMGLVVDRFDKLLIDFRILVFPDIDDILHNRVGGRQRAGALADERRGP
jgi:hypothetical protein